MIGIPQSFSTSKRAGGGRMVSSQSPAPTKKYSDAFDRRAQTAAKAAIPFEGNVSPNKSRLYVDNLPAAT